MKGVGLEGTITSVKEVASGMQTDNNKKNTLLCMMSDSSSACQDYAEFS